MGIGLVRALAVVLPDEVVELALLLDEVFRPASPLSLQKSDYLLSGDLL
jgi:hypothetical protein